MRPTSRGAASAVERARAEVEAAARARRAARREIAVEQRERARTVDVESGVTRVLYGPLRVEVERGALRAADDIAPAPIDYARRASRGWVFVANSAVYASETFTGRLRPLGAFRCLRAEGQTVVPEVSRERVTLSLHGGGVLWSDGDALHEFEDRDAVSLAWRDASRGAAIIGYRTLRVTRDGGAHWRAVDLRGETPVRVEGDDGGLRVVTDVGTRRIDDHDDLVAVDGASDVSSRLVACDVTADDGARLRSLDARLYDVAPEGPTAVCERRRAAVPLPWRAPAFALDVASVTPTDGDPAWNVPSASRSVLGGREARTALDSGAVAAVASLVMDRRRQGVQPVSLAWRGEDELGAFASRSRVRTPDGLIFGGQWTVAAATRRGLLFELSARVSGATNADSEDYVDDLFWFSSNAVLRTRVHLSGAGYIAGSVALSDGGAMVLGRLEVGRSRRCDGPLGEVNTSVAYALHLGPDGSERARRTAVDDPASRDVVGLGELDGRWGLVVAERAEPERLALLPLGGGEVPLGRWSFEGVPSPCGARAVGAARLHLLEAAAETSNTLSGVHVGTRPEGYDFADARDVSFEHVGERVCVRRVWASHLAGSYEVDFEDVRDVRAAVRFDARGDHMAGTFDDGERVASLRATVVAAPPPVARTPGE